MTVFCLTFFYQSPKKKIFQAHDKDSLIILSATLDYLFPSRLAGDDDTAGGHTHTGASTNERTKRKRQMIVVKAGGQGALRCRAELLLIQKYKCIAHTWLGGEFTVHGRTKKISADTSDTSYRLNSQTPHCASFGFMVPELLHNFDALHPDIWALIIILALFPFVTSELNLSFSVSSAFADAFATCGKHVYPVNPTLPPRTTLSKTTPQQAVAFHGSLSNILAAVIVGTDAALIALDDCPTIRESPVQPGALRQTDNLYYSLDHMVARGFSCHIVKSTLQNLVRPRGFVTPFAGAIAPLLFSNALNLGSIHVGAHLYDTRILTAHTMVLNRLFPLDAITCRRG